MAGEMSDNRRGPPWYAGGRGGAGGGDGDGGSIFIVCGSWSLLVCEEGIEWIVETVGVGDDAREGGSEEDIEPGDEGVDAIVRCKLVTELFGAWREAVDNRAFRRLLADCLAFSLHRAVALTHSFDFVRPPLSESTLRRGSLHFPSFFSTSFCSLSFRFRLHIRKAMMKTAMIAASTRDSESMRVVRMALLSVALDQPGGRESVSLVADGAEVVARSSIGTFPVSPEPS